MKKSIHIFLLLFMSSILGLKAQPIMPPVTVGFEELKSNILPNEVWNGSNGNTQYTYDRDGINLDLQIGWDTTWGGYWSNMWAFSRKNITTLEPSDFGKHLYASKAGKGAEDTGVLYAIGTQNTYILNRNNTRQSIGGFYISNTTFAFNSMYFGDNFGKKFSAADKDSFVLNIRCYQNQTLLETKTVILADFRSTDTLSHGFLDTWQYVNLSFPDTDSIHFELQSSDVGDWGINTPLYFALDGIEMYKGLSTKKFQGPQVYCYPNPSSDILNFANIANIQSLEICDFRGVCILKTEFPGSNINISGLSNGLYWVRLLDAQGNFQTLSFLKNAQ